MFPLLDIFAIFSIVVIPRIQSYQKKKLPFADEKINHTHLSLGQKKTHACKHDRSCSFHRPPLTLGLLRGALVLETKQSATSSPSDPGLRGARDTGLSVAVRKLRADEDGLSQKTQGQPRWIGHPTSTPSHTPGPEQVIPRTGQPWKMHSDIQARPPTSPPSSQPSLLLEPRASSLTPSDSLAQAGV